jgi:L-rhamnose mutarotase
MNRAMAEHVGLHTRLKAGTETAYDAAHAAVWPELLEAIRAAGFTRWLIFRDGLEVFHAIECESYERGIAELADQPVNQRWQAEMAQFMEVTHDYSGAASDRLPLIFDLG